MPPIGLTAAVHNDFSPFIGHGRRDRRREPGNGDDRRGKIGEKGGMMVGDRVGEGEVEKKENRKSMGKDGEGWEETGLLWAARGGKEVGREGDIMNVDHCPST